MLLAVPGLGLSFLMEGVEGGGTAGGYHHVPVLFDEAVHYLAPGAGKIYVDATLVVLVKQEHDNNKKNPKRRTKVSHDHHQFSVFSICNNTSQRCEQHRGEEGAEQ